MLYFGARVILWSYIYIHSLKSKMWNSFPSLKQQFPKSLQSPSSFNRQLSATFYIYSFCLDSHKLKIPFLCCLLLIFGLGCFLLLSYYGKWWIVCDLSCIFLLPSSPPHNALSPLFLRSTHTPKPRCSLCLEHTFPRPPQAGIPHFIQDFAQVSVTQRGLSCP